MDLPNRQSIRLDNYNYSRHGYYFVTICTQDRECIFGHIVGARRDAPAYMQLNDIGKIVKSVWVSLPDHHDVYLDKFQIMPNHVHFILVLPGRSRSNETGGSRPAETGGSRPAPTLGMVVGFLKSESTKRIRRIVGATRGSPISTTRGSPDTKYGAPQQKIWQRNYYEHIIRNEEELYRIKQYIIDNPKNWEVDRNNLSV